MARISDQAYWESQERSEAGIQADEDVVGAGRYILSFLLVGFLGLGIQYALLKKGWTATWINAGILTLLVIALAATG